MMVAPISPREGSEGSYSGSGLAPSHTVLLISQGNSFLGQHVAASLLRDGWKVSGTTGSRGGGPSLLGALP